MPPTYNSAPSKGGSNAALDTWCARALDAERDAKRSVRDCRSRSGFPKSPGQIRGAARDRAALAFHRALGKTASGRASEPAKSGSEHAHS
jgi:hypothetical protein